MEVRSMDSNTRMAFNTGVLYVQLIITVAVNLFSTRLILNAMGVEDFGIVNLIAGIVAMLSFIQNSMAISSQRYLTVFMGKNDELFLRKVFNTSFVLHLFFVIGLLTILVMVQPLIFNSSIQIPSDRIDSTKILYFLTILGMLLVVITVPFDALINAHEDMVVYSVISIIDSIIRLVGAVYITYYQSDKLIYYGLLIVTIRLSILLLKWIYCRKHYHESKLNVKLADRPLMKEMFSFAFWNMFGACAITGRNQGVAIILNTFFGVKINATYGIANQVGGQLSNFTSMIAKAMNPQIMKSAGAEDNDRVIMLTMAQCKITSLMMCWVVIPLFLTLPYVLEIWLKTVPDYCVIFCRYFLIVNLITQLSTGLMTAVQSSGKIRNYQIIVSIIILLNLPLAYIALRLDYPPQSVLVCMIFIEFFCVCFRALYARKIFKFESFIYFKTVLLPVLFAFILSSIVSFYLIDFLVYELNCLRGSFLAILLSLAITIPMTYIALSKKEREFVLSIVHKRIK